MKFNFDVRTGSITVSAKLTGPRGADVFTLILDTGADTTVINPAPIRDLGLETRQSKKIRLVTASGVEIGSTACIPRFSSLGKTKLNFEIVTLPLPKSIAADGVLGLDFFRGFELNINFKTGQIELK